MPIYNFQCEQCLEVFEVRATFKEKEAGLEPICPKCQSKETRQMISAGLVLRGSDGASLSLPACGPSAGPGCC
jgi:putative FmdB family regulatory protein